MNVAELTDLIESLIEETREEIMLRLIAARLEGLAELARHNADTIKLRKQAQECTWPNATEKLQ